jgi:hypothetical protein
MQKIPATHIGLHLQITAETLDYTDLLEIDDALHLFRHGSMNSPALVGRLWLRIAPRPSHPR